MSEVVKDISRYLRDMADGENITSQLDMHVLIRAARVLEQKDALIKDLVGALAVSDKTLDCVLSPEVEGVRNWKEWAGVEDASNKAKAALASARKAGIPPRFVKTDFDKDPRTKPGKPYRIVEAAPCNPAGEVIIVEVEGGVRLHSYLGPANQTWVECDASGLEVRAAQESYSRQLENG